MEIQKIFSDYYDEERFYSVLMNEDELYLYQSLFSDEDEEEVSGKGLSGLAKAGIGTAAVGGGVIGSKFLGKHLEKKAAKKLAEINYDLEMSSQLSKDRERLAKLAKKAAKQEKIGKALQKPVDYVTKSSKKVTQWVKSHPKTAAGIILGTAAAGYGAKKLHDRNNNDEV